MDPVTQLNTIIRICQTAREHDTRTNVTHARTLLQELDAYLERVSTVRDSQRLIENLARELS